MFHPALAIFIWDHAVGSQQVARASRLFERMAQSLDDGFVEGFETAVALGPLSRSEDRLFEIAAIPGLQNQREVVRQYQYVARTPASF